MNITVYPAHLKGKLTVPASKSLSHRALIAAGLAKGQSTLKNLLDSEDIEATKAALKAFNVRFDKNRVFGGDLKIITDTIDAKESGSTLRFMIPIALLFEKAIIFNGQKRLITRPLDVYENIFSNQVTYQPLSENSLPLKVKGPLKGGTFKVDGHISSQFISGLLFALPLLDEDSEIVLNTPLQSKDYVSLTLDILKQFGIKIVAQETRFFIPKKQQYQPKNMIIEGDFSQAAFFIAAGLINGDITLKNLNPRSLQGDRRMVDIVKAMGGDVAYDQKEAQYRIHSSKTKAQSIDLKDMPDLGPILMILAGLSEGITTFTSTDRLVYKESDRLGVMISILNKLGVKTKQEQDRLMVQGIAKFNGNLSFESYDDHRIVMALSIAALKASGPIHINGAQAVNKSYPRFFDDYKNLGGNFITKP